MTGVKDDNIPYITNTTQAITLINLNKKISFIRKDTTTNNVPI